MERTDLNSKYTTYLRKQNKLLSKKFVILTLICIFMFVVNVVMLVDARLDEYKYNAMQKELETTKQELQNAEKYYQDELQRVKDRLKELGIVMDVASVVYLEAGNQGATGMQLVADCIVNRVDSEQFKSTTSLQVAISNPRQFNALYHLDRITDNVKQSDDYQDAVNIVVDTLMAGPTTDVLFFMNPEISNVASRGWMERSKEFLFKYKDHVFYK